MGVNLDLSKVLHPRVTDLLTAFMPGLFFEICVLVANPALIVSFFRPPLDRPAAIFIFTVMGFIIGNFFMLWVSFIQGTINVLFRGCYLFTPQLWKKFLMYLLRARGTPPRPSGFAAFQFLQRAYQKAWDDNPFQEIARVWQRLANQLLKHYKIELPVTTSSEAWTAWSQVLVGFEPDDVRGYIMMVASQATGWAGLAAIHFAPALRSRYFLAFCLFSIFVGLLHGCGVAYRLCNPEYSWGIGATRTFEELQRVSDKSPDTEGRKEGK
jgi:hypothetical protein